jgi:peptidyl-tRNA hydrolase, PTH1 family
MPAAPPVYLIVGLGNPGPRSKRTVPTNPPLHVIVGLGNPGPKYDRTRHNVGFLAVDELARRHGITWRGRQARAEVAKGTINGIPVVLAKPQTFMNLSGESVSGLLNWHKVPVSRLIIIYDDMDLPLGSIRVRARGSAGGHNGMKSILQHLRSEEFARLRIGVERPPGAGENIDWVLGHFTKDEQRELQPALNNAVDAVEFWLANGIDKTMNAFNGSPAGGKEPPPQRKQKAPSPTQESPAVTATPTPSPERERPPLPGLGGQIAALRAQLLGKQATKPSRDQERTSEKPDR